MKRLFLIYLYSLIACWTYALQAVNNGIPWYDQNQNPVNAHGAGIIRDGGKYWLFGEYKSDTSNAFPGFGCYSSDDLVNWKFERVVLPVQKDGILGPNRVGERVKVMKCPKTGEYVMLMHADDLKYNDPHIGIATCKTINGDYQLRGTLQYKGQPIKRWDMGVFQDEDGKGYLLIHHGPIYRLSDDYLSVDTMIAYVGGMGESPAMFRKNGMYYLLTSNLTSWERNDNYYFTATNIAGPWKKQGLFCPEGSLTWNSQSTFVLMLPDGTPMYMGDRWSYPHQTSAATYVWLPMQVNAEKLSIPFYWQSWDAEKVKSHDVLKYARHRKPLLLYSNEAGKSVKTNFKGTHVAVVGKTDNHGGYGLVSVLNTHGDTVYSSLIDFYSKVPQEGIRVITPQMPYGKYTLEVMATGEKANWSDKRKNLYGSDDSFVQTSQFYVYGCKSRKSKRR
ncbi:family 43 glycosylhydrolase [Prevotella copri]|uniref:Family 43 glycosylhydrolase n=1 Tax=Segatella copri TaxID=165179 RepID=A0A6G1U3I6_9BACT|nr:family 43 glycosylhydrolase [Segatella copri]MQN82122.1 family 43 glycosylhydrolase [Segatella copri]